MEKYYIDLKNAISAEIDLNEFNGFLAMTAYENRLECFTKKINDVIELISNISDDITFAFKGNNVIVITKIQLIQK